VAVAGSRENPVGKLVWNIPFNGLSVAEGGVTTDTLLASAETEHEIRALAER
jgi:2-dehydropantoate 2-reductase